MTEERFQKLELAMEGVQKGLQQTGRSLPKKSLARPLPPPPASKAGKPNGPKVSCSGELLEWSQRLCSQPLAAGISMEHLLEMEAILRGKPRRIEELPRQKVPAKVRKGPLSESEEEEEVDEEGGGALLEGPGGQGDGGGSASSMEKAIVKLTAVASKLAGPKDKSKLEALLDGGSGGASGAESSSGLGSRRMPRS